MTVKTEKKINKFIKNDKFILNLISEYSNLDNFSKYVTKILDEELPSISKNTILSNLVLHTLIENVNTVQNVQNVLSCKMENGVKNISDLCFKIERFV